MLPTHLVKLADYPNVNRVRGTARSADKAAEWDDKHAEYKARMEWAVSRVSMDRL